MQKVGQMRLPKAGLPRQQRDAERPPLYTAQQFQAEAFMHLRKVHVWKIRHQQWVETVLIFLWQSYQGGLAFIFRVGSGNGKC
jgi:hypothetical protein